MKKRVISAVALVLCVLLAALTFAACGNSASGPEGKYVVKTVNGISPEESLKSVADSANLSLDDLLKQVGLTSVEEMVTLELKADGTASMNIVVFSTKMDGTWKQNGNKILITMDDQEASFTLNGNELSNDEGDPKYVLIKK